MLITKVKVGKVTNLSEARYCAGMGVDFLSFPISSIDPKTYQEITGWVAGPMFGIEVTKEDLEKFSLYNADFIQTSPELIDRMPRDKKLIVNMDVTDWLKEKAKLTAAKSNILFIELSAPSFDRSVQLVIDEARKEFEVLIKSSSSQDLEHILKLPIAGISLEGSSEVKVGLKEYPLSEILEQLESRD